jgi:hypothetical protein
VLYRSSSTTVCVSDKSRDGCVAMSLIILTSIIKESCSNVCHPPSIISYLPWVTDPRFLFGRIADSRKSCTVD